MRLYLSDYGDYYNVETVGDRRKNFWNRKGYEIIARRSEPSKIDAVSKSARPAPQLNKNGNEESNATEAIISADKGTTNFPRDQTNSGENSENLQSGEDMRFNVEGDGEIEGIDLNEAYELSEEEAAQLIDEWSTEEVNGLIDENGFDKNNQIV